jgi:hypothetical protein
MPVRLTPRLLLAPVAATGVVAAAFLVGDHAGGSPTGAGPGQPATSSARVVPADEFCVAFRTVADTRAAVLEAPSTQAVASLKAAVADLRDLAGGAEMTDSARQGVAYVVTALLALPDDATAQDVVDADGGATLADDAHADALADYVSAQCADLLSGPQ